MMLCMNNEVNSLVEKVDEKALDEQKIRRSKPEETIFRYGDNCVVVASTEDYKRSVPCFLSLKGALDMAAHAVEKNIVTESNLSDITKFPNSYIITFENSATFEISVILYMEMSEELVGVWTYGEVCEFLYKHCA